MKEKVQFTNLSSKGSNDDLEEMDSHPQHVVKREVKIAPKDPEAPDRPSWDNKWDFLMACLSYAVGLGTLWRFPYLVYRHGGGAFLIPYTIMNLIAGIPLFLMEMSIGQFSSSGVVRVWRLSPLFRGIGYAMVCVSAILAPYYNLIIAWSLVYLFSSFTSELPWATCNNFWNTINCSLHHQETNDLLRTNCTSIGGAFKSGICSIPTENFFGNFSSNCTSMGGTFEKDICSIVMSNVTVKSPGDEFFHNGVLDMTEGLEVIGGLRWKLVLALLGAWTITFLVISKGIQSSGKVAYFTAVFPYLVLVILLIRGCTLEGYEIGLKFYLQPVWSKLRDPQVWGDAAVQVTFSLSCGFGGVLTLSSYNKFKNNCIKDTWFICVVTYLTAIFSGFVIFSVLGFMSHKMNRPIEEVASQGAGLAFVIYPEAIAAMPVAPLWSILFFTMILTLGIGSQIAIVTTVISTIVDSSPLLLNRRLPCTAALCGFAFLIGLPLCSGAGMYILQLLDNYVATWSIVIICIMECIVVCVFYGADRLMDDIKFMTGTRPGAVWKFCWMFISPLTLMFILISMFVQHAKGKGSSYAGYAYPKWADSLGLFISFGSVMLIPIFAVAQILQGEGSLRYRLTRLVRPSNDWGPARAEDSADYKRQFGTRGNLPLNPSVVSQTPMLQNVINEEFMDSPLPSELDLEALNREANKQSGPIGITLTVPAV